MAAVLPGYEYDIFISYRHNDNRSGWVTDFVKALEVELAATIKFPVSVYFDSNPYTGLLETHHVHQSLEGKLKCLIFLPILSQTYCDTSSFAWTHEFCTFNKLAKEDRLGREIHLMDGNVASRILPIKIHDLDSEDLNLIEHEIGSVPRPIEFIYRRAGVNRPLLAQEEQPHDNLNKHLYRDQINKLANACKEILIALKSDSTTQQTTALYPRSITKKSSLLFITSAVIALFLFGYLIHLFYAGFDQTSEQRKPTIAILPFTVIGGPEGEYFATGMKEVLVKHLRINTKLSVPPSMVSTERFLNTSLSPSEIANQLGADYLVKAATQKWIDSIRINIELIDPVNDRILWANELKTTYTNVFQVQESIAQGISTALATTLTASENLKIKKKPTLNIEAYDYYLRGISILYQHYAGGDKDLLTEATQLLKASIAADPNFGEPYIELATLYFSIDENNDSVELLINKGLELVPDKGAGYNIKSQYLFFVKHDTTQSLSMVDKGIEIDPYSIDLLMWKGWLYHYWLKDGRELVALEKYLEAYKLNPDIDNAFHILSNIGLFFSQIRDYPRAESFFNQAISLKPDNIQELDFLARHYFLVGNFDALKKVIARMSVLHNTQYPKNNLHLYWSTVYYLYTNQLREGLDAYQEYIRHEDPDILFTIYSLMLYQSGRQSEAQKMWLDLITREVNSEQPDHFLLAQCYAMVNEPSRALDHLEQVTFTHTSHRLNPDFYLRDLMLKPLQDEPRFKKIVQPELDRLQEIQERIAKMERAGLIEIPSFTQN